MALEQAWIFLKSEVYDDINDESKCQECGDWIDPEDYRYERGLCSRCYDEMVQHTVAPDADLHHAGILDTISGKDLFNQGGN